MPKMDNLVLMPINQTKEENKEFLSDPTCQDTIYMSLDFYKRIGFNPPWIGYYVSDGEKLIASAAFKGKPVDGQVEIAYGTMEGFRQKGIGIKVCEMLVDLALKSDPSVIVTARTLPIKSYSSRILEKNHFTLVGAVMDPEDGEVWEWSYDKVKAPGPG